ncbi:MurR/RpiR family transcriptional regulator [Brucellaceae bacterium D45D]
MIKKYGHAKQSDRLNERISSRGPSLSPGLKAVINYIAENRSAILHQSALEIASHTATSDATVIRAIQALGFEGLRDLKMELQRSDTGTLSSAEKMAATAENLKCDLNATIDYVIENYTNSVSFLNQECNRFTIANAITLLKSSNRIAVFGLGASGILADYAVRMFIRNGYIAYSLNRSGVALGEQLLTMNRGDVLIMMAQETAHSEGITVSDEAQRLKVPLILVTASDLAAFQDRATVKVYAPRGQSNRFPLHGTILMVLETIILGLATSVPDRSTESLKRLNQLYKSLRKRQPRR